MKTFLKKIVIITSLLLGIIFVVIGVRLLIFNTLKWELPKDKTVAFMGASHVYRGIDASLLNNAVNLSKPSERYLFTYLKLKKLIEYNPQIKTIILQCAPTDLWQHSDDKYFVDNEMSEFVPLFYPMFDGEILSEYSGHYKDFSLFIIQHIFDFGLYTGDSYFRKIGYGQQEDALIDGVINIEDVKPAMIEGSMGNTVNLKYLARIIDYCKRNNINLFLVYFPVYHPEYYYDQKYYYDRIEQLGKVNYLDYSHYPIPDSCRYDAHHLNRSGAELFTKVLNERLCVN